ncbi:MAG: hypothetical protein KFB95_00775 [Simkaniaceae bacterium]|nr:MAG: hypothetical protein KFB95_00775 [Simkaniaceae bacterium]
MNEEISVEDGFQVVMIFLEPFFLNIIRPKMIKNGLISEKKMSLRKLEVASEEEKRMNELCDDNGFFFFIVCDGSSSDKYFEEIVEQRMNIPAIEQHHGLKVTKEMLFQLAIDFCDYFNKRFQQEGRDSLRFAIDWLEDMRNHPQKHKTEWDVWNKTIIDVINNGQKSLGFF